MGVGADDLFIMTDAWKQSKDGWSQTRGFTSLQQAEEDVEYNIARLAYAYRRATSSVFNTSFTTVIAFLATALSPITPVAGFGYFAALCVFVNFVWTMTLIPALLILCMTVTS